MTRERIELYIGLLDAVDTAQAHTACFATLSLPERRRAQRFALRRHQRLYVFAHGLLRLALSNYVPQIRPSDWSFEIDQYGRPFVAAPAIARTVYFSLSHTEGCVTCILSGHKAIGVDVEHIRERVLLIETARSTFSSEEIDALLALSPSEFVDRFFDYWTLKEAYLKATGSGLNLPIDQFSILISSEEIGIRFMPGVAKHSWRWHFTKSSPSPSHRLAIADGSGVTGGLPIIVRPWPLPALDPESANE
jgi:4'-phosphopantetheinyl transferase